MSDAPAERWLDRAWSLLVASSALYFLTDGEADNDLWMHLFSGRLVLGGGVPRADTFSYTAAGAPWVDHEWLTQAVFAALFAAAGSVGLWLFKVAVALLTGWLIWLPVTRRRPSAATRGGVMVLALAVLAPGYAVRPQIVSYLGVAALLAWLDREPPITWRAVVGATLAFALWANAHGAFIVGLGILALFAVVPAFDRRAGLRARGDQGPPTGTEARATLARRLALLAGALAGACLTPYGPSLFLYIAGELQVPHPLTEWQPVQITDPAHLPFAIMLALLVATLPFARTLRRRPWWAALVAIVAAMALRHQRHTPLLALCAAAPLAEQCEGALAWLRARTSLRLSPAATILLAAGLLGFAGVQLALLGTRLWRDRGGVVFAADDYPVGALAFVRARRLTGNLALPLDWGGYVLWHAAPGIKVSLDGRFATVYPPRVVEDNFAFFRGDADPAAGRLLDAYDTTLVLTPRGIPTPLQGRPEWRLLYTDQVAALYGTTGDPALGASDAPRGWLPFP